MALSGIYSVGKRAKYPMPDGYGWCTTSSYRQLIIESLRGGTYRFNRSPIKAVYPSDFVPEKPRVITKIKPFIIWVIFFSGHGTRRLLGNYICLEIIFAWKLHSLRNYILLEITFAWKLHLLGNYICLQITFACKLYLLANYIDPFH